MSRYSYQYIHNDQNLWGMDHLAVIHHQDILHRVVRETPGMVVRLMGWNSLGVLRIYTPPRPKTNMATEYPTFEDVFPIENGDFPLSC